MQRSSPLAQFSVFSHQSSALGGDGLCESGTGQSWIISRYSLSARRAGEAFTLIELLVVVAVIAILAGLTLATLGSVNRRSAESRARAEVAALSAAIESFKLETGSYPTNSASLYTNLCPPTGRVFFEPNPSMLATNGSRVEFIDPWNEAYRYTNSTNYFELWSTAGDTNISNSNNWIRN